MHEDRVRRVTPEIAMLVDGMEVGQSVLVDKMLAACIANRLACAGKTARRKSAGGGMVRVWRVGAGAQLN